MMERAKGLKKGLKPETQLQPDFSLGNQLTKKKKKDTEPYINYKNLALV